MPFYNVVPLYPTPAPARTVEPLRTGRPKPLPGKSATAGTRPLGAKPAGTPGRIPARG